MPAPAVTAALIGAGTSLAQGLGQSAAAAKQRKRELQAEALGQAAEEQKKLGNEQKSIFQKLMGQYQAALGKV